MSINIDSIILANKSFEKRINDILYECNWSDDYVYDYSDFNYSEHYFGERNGIKYFIAWCWALSCGKKRDFYEDRKHFYIPVALIECESIENHPELINECVQLTELIHSEKRIKELSERLRMIEIEYVNHGEWQKHDLEKIQNLKVNIAEEVDKKSKYKIGVEAV